MQNENLGKIRLGELEYGKCFTLDLDNISSMLALDEYEDDFRACAVLEGEQKGEVHYIDVKWYVIQLKEIKKAEYKTIQS